MMFFYLLFLASRLLIWLFPPAFSDVMYSYYHYARIWSEGYPPYLIHLFEYPPATIPLFYLPWLIDKFTPLDYHNAYRFLILLTDFFIFSLLIKVLKSLKFKKILFIAALSYYLLALTKAKDFVFESMDLVFIASFLFSLALLKIKKISPKIRFLSWFFFWLSTALKYISLPLFVPFLIMKKNKKFKEEILLCLFGFIAVWLLPLLIFRSSLSVPLVYHLKRGFQVESMPCNIIRLINRWTKTESFVEVYKNYDIIGPVTAKLSPYLTLIFLITMSFFALYSLIKSYSLAKKNQDEYRQKLRLSLLYFLLFLSVAKVFSTPFHLWLPPLLAAYPYPSFKKQLRVFSVSFFVILISMTPIPNLIFYGFETHNFIGLARPICLLYLAYEIYKT